MFTHDSDLAVLKSAKKEIDGVEVISKGVSEEKKFWGSVLLSLRFSI